MFEAFTRNTSIDCVLRSSKDTGVKLWGTSGRIRTGNIRLKPVILNVK